MRKGEISSRHSKWSLANPRKRHSDEVDLELQRIFTTIRWKEEREGMLSARILAEHSVEDLVLENEARKHPNKTLVLESGKGVFVKMPRGKIKHYNQSIERVKGYVKDSSMRK